MLDTEDLALLPSDDMDGAYHIIFDRVTFSYQKKGGQSADISFRLKRGERLGMLLMRLYERSAGEIRDRPGSGWEAIPRRKSLHTKFGVVFQNDILFADTIAGKYRFRPGPLPGTDRKAAA